MPNPLMESTYNFLMDKRLIDEDRDLVEMFCGQNAGQQVARDVMQRWICYAYGYTQDDVNTQMLDGWCNDLNEGNDLP